MTRTLKAKLSPRPRGCSARAPDPRPTAWLREESARCPGRLFTCKSRARELGEEGVPARPRDPAPSLSPGVSACVSPTARCPLSSWPHVSPRRGLVAPQAPGVSVAWVTFLRWRHPRPAPALPTVLFMPPLPVTATATPPTVFLSPASPAPAHHPHVAHTRVLGLLLPIKGLKVKGARVCGSGVDLQPGPISQYKRPQHPWAPCGVGAGPCARGWEAGRLWFGLV